MGLPPLFSITFVQKWEILDSTIDTATNMRRDRKEVAAIVDLTNRNQRNYMGDKTATGIRESLTTLFWEEKQHEGFKQNDDVV